MATRLLTLLALACADAAGAVMVVPSVRAARPAALAVVIPGDSLAEQVVVGGGVNFLMIYSTRAQRCGARSAPHGPDTAVPFLVSGALAVAEGGTEPRTTGREEPSPCGYLHG